MGIITKDYTLKMNFHRQTSYQIVNNSGEEFAN